MLLYIAIVEGHEAALIGQERDVGRLRGPGVNQVVPAELRILCPVRPISCSGSILPGRTEQSNQLGSPGVLSGRVVTRATVDQSIVPVAGSLLKTRRSNDHPSIVKTRVSVSSKAAAPDQAIDTRLLARTADMVNASATYNRPRNGICFSLTRYSGSIAHFQERALKFGSMLDAQMRLCVKRLSLKPVLNASARSSPVFARLVR